MTTSMYVVESHPNKEALAAEHLGLQGFSPIYPRCIVGGRVRPLFRSHLFVWIDMELVGMREYSRAISYTRGVRRIYGGERPTPLPAAEAALIAAQYAAGPLDEAAWRMLCEGLMVQVAGGAWDGWTGVIEGFSDDRARAQLLIGGWRVWQKVGCLEQA